MRTIHLYGPLAAEFGQIIRLEVATAAEAVLAMGVVLGRRFTEILRQGEWHIVAGEALEQGEDFGDPALFRFGLGKRDLHLLPAIVGSSGGGGIFKAVLGVAILAAAVSFAPAAATWALPAEYGGATGVVGGMGAEAISAFGMTVTYGNIAMSGLVMALGGLSQMLTSTPTQSSSYSSREDADSQTSFLFNGAKNTVEQGNPVSVCYGRFQVGGTIISAGIEVEEVSS